MHSEMTMDAVEGQIVTATGLLQWTIAETEKARWAWSVSPLLIALAYLLGSLIRKIEREGIEHFDPEHAGFAAEKFREITEHISEMVAHSDAVGLCDHFPSKTLLRRIQLQGDKFSKLASLLIDIDIQWQAKVAQAAQTQIELARQAALSIPEEATELFEETQDVSESPSAEALRAHLKRTLSLPK